MALREGWLHKEGGSFKTWKKRWFVIEGDEFAYYNKKGGKSPPPPFPPSASFLAPSQIFKNERKRGPAGGSAISVHHLTELT